MRYNPALDGLRAVAVLLVILTHSFLHIFPGGWIGVDVFFVLSGYLITSILMREIIRTGRIAWGDFYRRRFIRLTPALLILAAFQFAHAAFSPHNAPEIRTATLVGLIYMENWNAVFNWRPAELMGHTWSLATEEQFYWVWPITLLLIARRRPLVWLGGAAAAIIAVRIILWLHGDWVVRIQEGPHSRPIGLILGCALALMPAAHWPRVPAAMGFGLLGLLGMIAVGGGSEAGPFLIAAPIVASIAAALIIMAAQPGTAFAQTLAVAPSVYVGKISYGLYLYSFPICALGAVRGINPLALIVISMGAAALSYEFIEKPCLRLKDRLGTRPALPLAIANG